VRVFPYRGSSSCSGSDSGNGAPKILQRRGLRRFLHLMELKKLF
jgi:hypothetical protein